ncbi:hypothetical protein [Modestobacter sp. VKM Ac-2985]|uniref:hypothetical protein n=1 Tax=Modestobacter sp. VKM Ac-2985 TaxID=3004139 RepID=UPI0022AB663E|nr:hypothetical protein [Modestobacter sp. VKM Ac-2985]MCZ2837132.1 hypothetical protein [Modestobacter sp. VKM Ac-2985]
MTQVSAPLVNEQFTDAAWRDLFGDEPGVVGDLDGTSYNINLPPDSNVALIGSPTQDSLSRVAGFSHKIPAGQLESIVIPEAPGSTRTDLVVVRYDPANNDAPGPCRLAIVTGTSAGFPAYDSSAPGVEDLPLWAVTRKADEALSQATVRRLYPRLAPLLNLPLGALLPTSSPLGTLVRRGQLTYVRELDTSGVPTWIPDRGMEQIDTLCAPDIGGPLEQNSPRGLHSSVRISQPFGPGVPFRGEITAQCYVVVQAGSEIGFAATGDPSGPTTRHARSRNDGSIAEPRTVTAHARIDSGSSDAFNFQPIMRQLSGTSEVVAEPRLAFSTAHVWPK